MSGGKARVGETELRNLVGWRTGVDNLGRPVRVPIAQGCSRCGAADSARYWRLDEWFCTDCWVATDGGTRGLVA